MCWAELFFILLVLIAKNSSENCIHRSKVNALEGEPFYLMPCLYSSPAHKNGTPTIRWAQNTTSRGYVELSNHSSPRIVLQGYTLQFWPVELDDQGSYSSRLGNTNQTWDLKVIKRDKQSCYTKEHVISKSITVKEALSIKCKKDNYQKPINKTLLLKDCKDVSPNNHGRPAIGKNAEFSDRGYYTCVFSILHNGILYNITETHNVTISKENRDLTSQLYGPTINFVEVELGKDVELNCSALLNENDGLYWSYEAGGYENVHEDTTMRTWTSEGKRFASRLLRIKTVTESNLNFKFNCTTSNHPDFPQAFILVRKDMTDIPGHVFTRGIVVAISISVTVVCLAIICIVFKVDLVLFYRRLVQRDETLTDGKIYDAFVSYLKECHPENGEEHTFAVETLPTVLEKQFGYKLCIFERDVVPGRAVVDEIQSLIEKSRRLIIVLSNSYMRNSARLELHSGLHQALVERKMKIILIEFTPLGDFTLLPQSLKLLKSYRRLKWKANESLSCNSRFWKNLLYLMPAKPSKAGTGEESLWQFLSNMEA